MNAEQLNKLFGQLAVLDEDERRAEEDVALFVVGPCPPDVKSRIEALMAEDEEFRAEVEARRAEFSKFTPARQAALEERILVRGGVGTEVPAPVPLRRDVLSDALREVVRTFHIAVAILKGPIVAFDAAKPEDPNRDQTAITRVLPTEDGVEIEVVSQNEADAGARIEVFVSPGDWRAELTLKKLVHASAEVRDSVRLTKEQLGTFSRDAEIRLR